MNNKDIFFQTSLSSETVDEIVNICKRCHLVRKTYIVEKNESPDNSIVIIGLEMSIGFGKKEEECLEKFDYELFTFIQNNIVQKVELMNLTFGPERSFLGKIKKVPNSLKYKK